MLHSVRIALIIKKGEKPLDEKNPLLVGFTFTFNQNFHSIFRKACHDILHCYIYCGVSLALVSLLPSCFVLFY